MVPYLVSLLSDKASIVRAHAMVAVTHALCQVLTFPASDAQLFPSYILPAVSKLFNDSDIMVQLAFAESLPLVRLSPINQVPVLLPGYLFSWL